MFGLSFISVLHSFYFGVMVVYIVYICCCSSAADGALMLREGERATILTMEREFEVRQYCHSANHLAHVSSAQHTLLLWAGAKKTVRRVCMYEEWQN